MDINTESQLAASNPGGVSSSDPRTEAQGEPTNEGRPSYWASCKAYFRLRRSWLIRIGVPTWASFLLKISWLVPISWLLWANGTSFVIGHSLGCGSCPSGQLRNNAFEIAMVLDKQDHAALGSLQIAAKALDTWFVLIAANVVFRITLQMASSDAGLPLGYLMTHLHFANLITIISPSFYRAANTLPEGQRKRWTFVAYIVLICIVANAMGPAISVLLIPSVQWKDTEKIPEQRFNRLALDLAPRSLQNCSETELAKRKYSCTSEIYASMLDGWLDAGFTNMKQTTQKNAISYYDGLSQQRSIVFKLNVTRDNGSVSWAPNRQLLNSLSSDFHQFFNTTRGDPSDASYHEYNRSLSTVLKREGPMIGFRLTQLSNSKKGGYTILSNTTVGDNKDIRCYTGWQSEHTGEYTKCYRVGHGWHPSNSHAQFFLGGVSSSDPVANISIYFSDRSTYLNETNHFSRSSPRTCLDHNGAVPVGDCDWQEIFNANLPDNLGNSSTNVTIIEYEVLGTLTRFVYEFTTNPLNLVYTRGFGATDDEPFVVNPDWILASWSVDRNGILAPNRTAARLLLESLTGTDSLPLAHINAYSFGQALSMVNYSYVDKPTKITNTDVIFNRYATISVWAFGLGRVTIYAYVFVGSGILCVIVPAIFWSVIDICRLSYFNRFRFSNFRFLLQYNTHVPSMMEIVAAALERSYQNEFANFNGNPEQIVKVRYFIREENGKVRITSQEEESGNEGSTLPDQPNDSSDTQGPVTGVHGIELGHVGSRVNPRLNWYQPTGQPTLRSRRRIELVPDTFTGHPSGHRHTSNSTDSTAIASRGDDSVAERATGCESVGSGSSEASQASTEEEHGPSPQPS